MTEEQARRRAKKEREFYGHLATYLVVNAALVAMNVVTGGAFWAIWPLLGWGIGLGSHAVSLFGLPGRAGDWEERRVRVLLGEEGSATRLRTLVDEAVSRRAVPAREQAGEVERLRQRVEHLEAIVTSRDWDLLENPAPPGPMRAERRVDLPDEPADETPEAHAERLSRRVR